MSERVAGFIVTLERDVKNEDLEAVQTALEMVRNVLKVHPIPDEGESLYPIMIATDRVRQELGTKLWEVLYPKGKL